MAFLAGSTELGLSLLQATVRQLRDEIKTFLLAGHETSASMLTWSLYELTQNPECMERAVAEGRCVLGSPLLATTKIVPVAYACVHGEG